jgi:hypothetical protein
VRFAIRLIGNSWYRTHDGSAIASSSSLDEAQVFLSEQDATTTAMIVTMAHPQWMRKVRVQKVRCIHVPKIRCLNPEEKRSDRRQYERYSAPHYVTC